MIRVYFNKLKNGKLEITEKMLDDILSYMKRQDNIIEEVNHLLQVYLDTQEDKVWRMYFYNIMEKTKELKGESKK